MGGTSESVDGGWGARGEEGGQSRLTLSCFAASKFGLLEKCFASFSRSSFLRSLFSSSPAASWPSWRAFISVCATASLLEYPLLGPNMRLPPCERKRGKGGGRKRARVRRGAAKTAREGGRLGGRFLSLSLYHQGGGVGRRKVSAAARRRERKLTWSSDPLAGAQVGRAAVVIFLCFLSSLSFLKGVGEAFAPPCAVFSRSINEHTFTQRHYGHELRKRCELWPPRSLCCE